jgi:RNA polymerase sigma factor (sigma-70 family)
MMIGQHRQRCYKKWVGLRTKLLLDLIGDCLVYDFAGVRDRMLGREGFDRVEAYHLYLILRDYLGRQEGARASLRAWFRPVDLSLQDEDHILESLRRLELQNDLAEPFVTGEDEAGLRVSGLVQDPLISEYGALPAARGAEEREHLITDGWLARAAEVIPKFDEERARNAFVLDIADSEVVSVFEKLDQAELRDLIRRTLKTLTPREELVLKMRFGVGDGEEHEIDQIARTFNVTTYRIRQIAAKALRKLRHPSRASRLLPYLRS